MGYLFHGMLLSGRTRLPEGIAAFIISGTVMALVSVLTFRIAEGAALMLSTMTACAIVYYLSVKHKSWS
jgi:hypothetical protein